MSLPVFVSRTRGVSYNGGKRLMSTNFFGVNSAHLPKQEELKRGRRRSRFRRADGSVDMEALAAAQRGNPNDATEAWASDYFCKAFCAPICFLLSMMMLQLSSLIVPSKLRSLCGDDFTAGCHTPSGTSPGTVT